jgi:hypothetical protein
VNTSNNQTSLKACLICLALATLGLLIVSAVLHDADPQTTLSASSPSLAEPVLSRSIAGLALQAEGLFNLGVVTPTCLLLGLSLQLLRRL